MNLAIMNDWKKKAVLGFASAAALGAFGFAAATNASADTVKTVQSGDTLWGISQTTGQSVDSIKSVNHLTSDMIYVGQHLTVSGSTVTTPAATSAPVKTYTTTTQTQQTIQAPVQKVNTSTQTTTAPTQSTTAQAATSVQQTQNPVQKTSTLAQQTTQTSAQKTSTPSQATTAPTQNTTTQAATSTANDSSAKNWIAQHESGGSYTAQNGQYYGKYQLSASYLNGDYSAANQERVANAYVNSRYGSWDNAKQHWVTTGWY